MRIRRSCAALLVLAACGLLAAFQPDMPDSAVNPVTGLIEIADPVWSGTNHDIHYVINSDPPEDLVVTSNPADDWRPRLAIAHNGDAWVVWWREGNPTTVLSRKRTQSDGSWSAERVLSPAGEDCSNPYAVVDGTGTWVAYEKHGPGAVFIAVGVIIDEPEPIDAPTSIASTGYTGTLDVRAHSESGNLWVTWIDSATEVGWSEFDAASGTWSAAAYESYSGSTVVAARAEIRTTVLGN